MLINKVKLYSNRLREMQDFYVGLLGFQLVNRTEELLVIRAGESILEFHSDYTLKNPFYHFAFNIPSNQFDQAKEWIKTKVPLNQENGKEEVYFDKLEESSLYFMDPSENIVEFISRKSAPKAFDIFSVQQILNLSEVNITTDDVQTGVSCLDTFGLSIRNGDGIRESVNFMGELDSFVVVGRVGRRWLCSNKYSEIHPNTIVLDYNKMIEVDRNGNINCKLL